MLTLLKLAKAFFKGVIYALAFLGGIFVSLSMLWYLFPKELKDFIVGFFAIGLIFLIWSALRDYKAKEYRVTCWACGAEL